MWGLLWELLGANQDKPVSLEWNALTGIETPLGPQGFGTHERSEVTLPRAAVSLLCFNSLLARLLHQQRAQSA